MEAGLDSLGAVELRNALADRCRISSLPATAAFDYSSIAAMAAFISTQRLQLADVALQPRGELPELSLEEVQARVAAVVQDMLGPSMQLEQARTHTSFTTSTCLPDARVCMAYMNTPCAMWPSACLLSSDAKCHMRHSIAVAP